MATKVLRSSSTAILPSHGKTSCYSPLSTCIVVLGVVTLVGELDAAIATREGHGLDLLRSHGLVSSPNSLLHNLKPDIPRGLLAIVPMVEVRHLLSTLHASPCVSRERHGFQNSRFRLCLR
eukprot:12356428-Heterocapsa_arctica.AAC.1